MCRLFAYRGTPLPLSAWLLDAPHSLEKQAYQPREMVSGTVNVDGTGVTWWPGEDEPALRYLFDGPPWADPNFGHLMPRLLSGAQLAVVRSATPGIGHGIEHVQPFLDEETDLAFAHNGWIGGFRGAVGHALVSGLDPELLGTLPAFNDSAALFCAVAQRHRQGMLPADALAETLTEVVSRCQRNGHAASLNVVLATAETTIAARWAHGVPANSLYTSIREQGVLLASEALDTPEHWHPVQTGTVIELRDHTVTVTKRLS